MSSEYLAPDFVIKFWDQSAYKKWLYRKAAALLKRDRGRDNDESTREEYRREIHAAVIRSNGKDFYTGELLDWSLLSQYDNEESKKHRRKYKKKFALLPTVDHVGDGQGLADFEICSWRTNDSKSDLTHGELIEFCKKVIAHSEA